MRSLAAAILLLLMLLPSALRAQTCTPTGPAHAESFSGEIAGKHAYVQDVMEGLQLNLQPIAFGWQISLLDDAGQDLISITPPVHLLSNPLKLEGWHFRNAANTASNSGDVNAPQHERRFSFLVPDTRTGSSGGTTGFGWLKIEDMGLADLDEGQRARMVYLRFSGCLIVPKTHEELLLEGDLASPAFLTEEIELMGRCGLGSDYQLDAWVLPRWLDGDFDADGVMDFAAPVIRASTGERALAICRAGTWLGILKDPLDGPDTPRPDYLAVLEAWSIDEPDAGSGADAIMLERREKSAYRLFWTGSGFATHQIYGLPPQ